MKDLKINDYTVTLDYEKVYGGEEFPEEVAEFLHPFAENVFHPTDDTLLRLQKAVAKYPDNIRLKNQLTRVYLELDLLEEAELVNEEVREADPDDLLGKLLQAELLYYLREYERMPEVLGENFDLGEICPSRDLFYIGEYVYMRSLAVQYYLQIDEIEKGTEILEELYEIGGKNPFVPELEELYSIKLLEVIREESGEEGVHLFLENLMSKAQWPELPALNCDEVKALFEYGFEIPQEILTSILKLPRKKLIEDLETLIKESIVRAEKNRLSFEGRNYPLIHALFLLGELEAEESLPVVLELFRQDERFQTTNFSFSFYGALRIPLFKMAKNRLEELRPLVTDLEIIPFFRITILEALEHGLNPVWEQKGAADVFDSILEELNSTEGEVDDEYNAMVVWALTNSKMSEFLPAIKELYQKRRVEEYVVGSYEEIKEVILGEEDPLFLEMLSLEEIYDTLLEENTWSEDEPDFYDDEFEEEFFDEEDFFDEDAFEFSPQKPVINLFRDLGRNDPCPCGSGKKFKKCCLGKGIYD